MKRGIFLLEARIEISLDRRSENGIVHKRDKEEESPREKMMVTSPIHSPIHDSKGRRDR